MCCYFSLASNKNMVSHFFCFIVVFWEGRVQHMGINPSIILIVLPTFPKCVYIENLFKFFI